MFLYFIYMYPRFYKSDNNWQTINSLKVFQSEQMCDFSLQLSPGYQIMSVWNAKLNSVHKNRECVPYIKEIKYISCGIKTEQILPTKILTCHSRQLFPVDHFLALFHHQSTVERFHDQYHLSSL